MCPFSTLPPDISWADTVFDGMMVSRMAVYRKDQILDRYGNVSNTVYTRLNCTMADSSVVDQVPCLVQALHGYELNTPPAPQSQTSYGVKQFKIFCRPFDVVDTPPDLTIRHFLQVLTQKQVALGNDYPDPNDPNAKAVLYNLTDDTNTALLDHHFELYATVLTA